MQGLKNNLVVVGGTLDALRYASEHNGSVLLFCNPEPPHMLEDEPGLSQEWTQRIFDLSMQGRIPLGSKIKSIRLLDEKNFRVILQNSFFNVEFERAVIFSDKGIEGLPTPVNHEEKIFKVLDWITMRDGMTHKHNRIDCDDSQFVNHILFYPTKRLDGHHPDKKDAVAVSYMSEENLSDILWSDSYVRLKAIRLMREVGIRFSTNRIETSHREVIPLKKKKYPQMKTVEFK